MIPMRLLQRFKLGFISFYFCVMSLIMARKKGRKEERKQEKQKERTKRRNNEG